MKTKLIYAGIGVAMLGITSLSYAAGFKVSEQGAKAQAMGNAFAAQADDPSALAYNPAGIAFLKGNQLQLGTGIILVPQTEFSGVTNVSSPNPASEKANGDIFIAPTVYLTSSLESIPLSFGLGVNSFFPLAKRWDAGGALRETAEVAIKPINFQPTVAYRFDNLNLAVAAGADITYARFTTEKFVFNAPLGGDLGMLGMDATAVGYGYNLGLLWKPKPTLSFGVTYRSEIKLGFDGDANFLGLANSAAFPAPLNLVFPPMGTTVRSKVSADLTLPDNLILGVAWKPIDKLTLEFDAERTGWSSYNQVAPKFESSAPIYASVLNTPTPKNWKDVWAYHFGGQYAATKNIDLRAGYTFDETPSPDSTFSGDIPDADRHYFNIGAGLHHEYGSIDLAYTFAHFVDRTIGSSANNPQTKSGTFKSDAHMLGISLTYKF